MVDEDGNNDDGVDIYGFGIARTGTLSSSTSDGFIALPPRSSLYTTSKTFAAQRHPPRSGGLSAPRAPFEGLSIQTRTLLARRAAASSAHTAAAVRAIAASREANITHAPPREDPSDDEYETEM
jgi:hypothetical protein